MPTHVLGEVHPVDQQGHQLQSTQIASHQLGQAPLGADHEPLAHRAFADTVDPDLLRQRLQRARVAAGGNSHHHLLESPFIERIVRTPRPPTRQAEFVTIGAARPRTFNLDPPAAQDQGTRHVPRPHRVPLRLMRVTLAAQRRALRLQLILHEPESRQDHRVQ